MHGGERLERRTSLALAASTPHIHAASRLGAMVSLFELSTDLLATVGPDGRFAELSPSWRVVGWSEQELKAKPFSEFIHLDDREHTGEMIAKAKLAPAVITFEARFRHSDGNWCWLAFKLRSDGETLYLAAKDVTERKLLELRTIHDDLTGLPNRALVMDRLAHALHRGGRTGGGRGGPFLPPPTPPTRDRDRRARTGAGG